jgi:small-conductance mechanosensitive channel
MSRRPSRFKSDLNYLICKHLDAAGIELPNPQRDLHIRSGTLKVENVTNSETTSRSEVKL